MRHVSAEIASQPDCWRRAAASVGELSGLPLPGERVAVVGCGTSYYMAQAYAVLRETGERGLTDAFAASEMPAGRRYDRVLAISRSGTTTEILQLLGALRDHVPTTAITADATAPIMATADATVVLDYADEQSVVQTRFATTTLTLLRAHIGIDVAASIADAVCATTSPLPAGALEKTQFSFLGRGWTVGLANEAALKMREASLSWSDAYPSMEYRHGPISVAGPDSLVWAFGEVPDGLAGQVTRTGATFLTGSGDPLAELILAQRLAVAVAEAKGLDPDRPQNLTRSVILDPADVDVAG